MTSVVTSHAHKKKWQRVGVSERACMTGLAAKNWRLVRELNARRLTDAQTEKVLLEPAAALPVQTAGVQLAEGGGRLRFGVLVLNWGTSCKCSF